MTRQPLSEREQTKRDIHVGVDKNTLRIQFPRKVSQELFGQKQKYLYIGLTNTPENWIEAEKIALQIENDIRAKKLEKNLKVYLPINALKQTVGLFYNPNQIQIAVIDLFNQYCEFIKPQLQETTYICVYQQQYKRILSQAPQDLNAQNKLVDHLFKSHSSRAFIDVCALLSRMLNWSKKRGIIPQESPNQFASLRQDYKVATATYKPGRLVNESFKNYNQDKDYRAFTRQEAQTVIKAFDDYAQPQMIYRGSSRPFALSEKKIKTRCMIRDYVKLKFWTGCRNGEASALRWMDIDDNFEYILFRKNYSSALKILKLLKTEHIGEEGKDTRKFPCGEKLKLLLEDLYQRNYRGNPEDFIFVSLSGKPIDNCSISYHWYGKDHQNKLKDHKQESCKKLGVVTQLVIDKKISQYLTPYATRHTWITLQL